MGLVVEPILQFLSKDDSTIDDWIARQYGYLAEYSMKRQFSKKENGPVLRFSGCGKRARQIAYEYHGFQANGKTQDSRSKIVFLYGDLLEALIVSLAKAAGVQITACGLDQKKISLEIEGVQINGHPDGLIITNPIHTFECKSMSSFGYGEFERGNISHEYLVQVNLGMEALGLDRCVFVAIEKESGVMSERIVHKDESIIEWVRQNVSKVIHSTPDNLPERCFTPNEKGFYPWQCVYCKFYKTCLVEPGLAKIEVVKNANKLKAIQVEAAL